MSKGEKQIGAGRDQIGESDVYRDIVRGSQGTSSGTEWWLPAISFGVLVLAVNLTTYLRGQERPPQWLSSVAYFLGHGVNSLWVGVGLLILIVPSVRKWGRTGTYDPWAWRTLDAVLLDFLLVDALGKELFLGLVRPGEGNHPGFPSGHAVMAFILANLVWRRYPKLGPFWFAMATLISWSRVQSNAHFPYQVIAGFFYGTGIAYLVLRRSSGVLLPRVLLSDEQLQVRLAAAPDSKFGQNA